MNKIFNALKKIIKFHFQLRKTNKPIMLYVSGCPNSLNLGDEALFEAYKLIFNEYDLVHYSGGRILTYYNKLFNIKAVTILAGGTLINRWGLDELKEAKSNYKNFNVFGTGVAQTSYWKTQSEWDGKIDEWINVFGESDSIGVRGPLSLKLLQDHGCKNSEVVYDPVLFFAKETNDNKYVKKRIGLNIGQSHGQVWGSEDDILNQFIELAKKAKKNSWEVVWLVIWPKDLDITLKAAELSNTASGVYEVYSDYNEYLNIVEKCAFFVGMKLHSVILAHCVYVPSFMIEYRPKCKDYMLSVNHEKFNIRSDEFKSDKLWNIITKAEKNRDKLSDDIFTILKKCKAKQVEKSNELKSKMKIYLNQTKK